MDKNRQKGTLNFLKKEGFYVILFVCLCVVATVAALTAKRSLANNNQPPVAIQDNGKKSSSNIGKLPADVQSQLNRPDNATQVNSTGTNGNSSTASNSQNNTKTASQQQAVAVSVTPTLNFYKPTVGTLLMGFSDLAEVEPTDNQTMQKLETVEGMYINAKIGQDVYAAESGTVVENKTADNFGVVVTIKHINGFTTVYGNLDKQLNVKIGDKVTRGQKIGVIGQTSNHYPKKEALANGFLYLQVLKDDVPVNPATYIKY